eukprot:TRINITY_DN2191_c0_g1_i1.p1 TRINITY_DN2191_c0_g1~~TRINITY_DN2191_c0_g1_i1.p1  ORF type:complete len:114 (+),score=11.44 TRINITY_DN2191_c0_g1_i1:674-1015(+)
MTALLQSCYFSQLQSVDITDGPVDPTDVAMMMSKLSSCATMKCTDLSLTTPDETKPAAKAAAAAQIPASPPGKAKPVAKPQVAKPSLKLGKSAQPASVKAKAPMSAAKPVRES